MRGLINITHPSCVRMAQGKPHNQAIQEISTGPNTQREKKRTLTSASVGSYELKGQENLTLMRREKFQEMSTEMSLLCNREGKLQGLPTCSKLRSTAC